MLTEQPPGSLRIYSLTALPNDTLTMTTLEPVRAYFGQICRTATRNVQKTPLNQIRYKKCFDQTIPATPKFSIWNFINVDHQPLDKLSIARKAEKYNNLLFQRYGPITIILNTGPALG